MTAVWDAWIEQARNADILAVAQSYGAKVKKNGSAEWEGPCPHCGGKDRFSINTRKRICNCRGCGLAGDVITFVGPSPAVRLSRPSRRSTTRRAPTTPATNARLS